MGNVKESSERNESFMFVLGKKKIMTMCASGWWLINANAEETAALLTTYYLNVFSPPVTPEV